MPYPIPTRRSVRSRLFTTALTGVLLACPLAAPTSAAAATPKDILIEVGEHGPNSLDPMTPAANELSQLVAWQIYDRLVTHAMKTLPDGKVMYDATKLEPELATSWEVSDDGKTMVFHLRKDATFHDGSPVTAADVKWSFDRAIAAGGFPAIQMAAGSYTDPNSFSVVDEHTFKIALAAPNKLALPDLAVPVPDIVNSKLALSHATTEDPWALNWTRDHDAGGGPFKVASWKAGDQIVFDRFDDWKSGPLPKLKRVVYREIEFGGHAARVAGEGRRRRLGRAAAEGLCGARRRRQGQCHRHADAERNVSRRHECDDEAVRRQTRAPGDRLCASL